VLRCLPDGRWFDEKAKTWRDSRNRIARWPDLIEAARVRATRAVLAAAHLNHDPRDNRLRNLHALCQRCHLLHDREHHRVQRRLTLRRRWARQVRTSWRRRSLRSSGSGVDRASLAQAPRV
jgi:hypothetical protein